MENPGANNITPVHSNSNSDNASRTPMRSVEVLKNNMPRLISALNESENQLLSLLDEKEELATNTPNSIAALEKINAEIDSVRNIVNIRKESLELRQNLLKRMLTESVRLNNTFNNDMNESFMIQPKNKIIVPSNLPKFRHENKFEEPIEFLESFNKVMKAHNISEDRYLQLLPLCLDSVDGQWLATNSEVLKALDWSDFMNSFIEHFQHPNAAVSWQDKIRQLHVDNNGVQKYTDQFIRLAKRLEWELDSTTAIYQYKQGLPEWILDSITAAEAATLATSNIKPNVEMLGKMALNIEASKRKKSMENSKYLKNDKIIKCTFCHKLGHLEPDCRIKIAEKRKSTTSSSPSKDEKNQTNSTSNGNSEKSKTPNKSTKPPDGYICRICNKPGHWIQRCPDFKKNFNTESNNNNNNNKSVRAATKSELKIQNNNDINNTKDKISAKCVEIPCTVNGQKVLGLLDTGAELSFVDIHMAKKNNWKIESQTGFLNLALLNKQTPRIGVICNVIIRAGKYQITTTLEVAELSGNTQFIIGMDIFHQLGFKLMNHMPFSWPQDKPIAKQKPATEMVVIADKQSELS